MIEEDDPLTAVPAPTGSGARVRVGVVDDHEMFRAGVVGAISSECEVVGQAGDVESAVAMIAATQPDVVLLDVHLPGGQGGGGSEIILNAVEAAPKTLYLALSVSDSPVDVGAVIRAGARGYVTKTITAADLLSSIHQVAQGYAVFSPRLAGFVLNAFEGATVQSARGGPPSFADRPDPRRLSPTGLYAVGVDGPDELDSLSPREQEVMRLIARGYTNKEVAAALVISIKTVETHASAVLRKLQLSNRGELARWAAHRRIA